MSVHLPTKNIDAGKADRLRSSRFRLLFVKQIVDLGIYMLSDQLYGTHSTAAVAEWLGRGTP